MQPGRACARHAVLHRAAGQLVAEPHDLALEYQHPGVDAVVQRCRLRSKQRRQQRDLGPVGHQRDDVEDRPRGDPRPGSAGQHDVADGHWYVLRRGADYLGDEERIRIAGTPDSGATVFGLSETVLVDDTRTLTVTGGDGNDVIDASGLAADTVAFEAFGGVAPVRPNSGFNDGDDTLIGSPGGTTPCSAEAATIASTVEAGTT